MDPKKIKNKYLTKNIKMKKLDIKTDHNLIIKREEELSIADFYNKELKKKVYKFYQKDFEILKNLGYDYDIKI